MPDLDHGTERAVPSIDGGASQSKRRVEVDATTNETQVRSAIAAGLRLVAQGIILIADALGDKCCASPMHRKAARRTGVRLPPEPTAEPSSEAELSAAARAARRAGILVD